MFNIFLCKNMFQIDTQSKTCIGKINLKINEKTFTILLLLIWHETPFVTNNRCEKHQADTVLAEFRSRDKAQISDN